MIFRALGVLLCAATLSGCIEIHNRVQLIDKDTAHSQSVITVGELAAPEILQKIKKSGNQYQHTKLSSGYQRFRVDEASTLSFGMDDARWTCKSYIFNDVCKLTIHYVFDNSALQDWYIFSHSQRSAIGPDPKLIYEIILPRGAEVMSSNANQQSSNRHLWRIDLARKNTLDVSFKVKLD